MKKKQATEEQLELALELHIPISKAQMINPEKVKKYREYLSSPQGDLETFLDSLSPYFKTKDYIY